jgi:hypothetical protein
MRSVVIAVLVMVGCEQHTPGPVRHAEPPPPRSDGGTAVAPADGSFARGAPYCPGERPVATGQKACMSDDDCAPRGRCYPDGVPDYSGMCGVNPQVILRCSRDADCGKHEYCEHTREQHGCGEVIEGKCIAACTATSCKDGEVCGKDGRCAPQQCADGYACRPGWTCDKAGYIHDPHGCRQPACTATSCPVNQQCMGDFCDVKRCSTTADCDCGACFGGICKPHPGVCGPLERPQPPP